MIYERGIFCLKNSVMLSKSSRGQLALFIFRSFSMFDVEGKRGRQKTEARIPAGVMEEMESVMHRCAALFQVLGGEGRV